VSYPLTEAEQDELARLLAKLTWPVPEKTFRAICENLIMTAVELAVLRGSKSNPEVFMVFRDDSYWPEGQWHMPGTILLPGKVLGTAMPGLIEREVGRIINEPHFVGCYDLPKGGGYGQSRRGQVVSRLYAVWVNNESRVRQDERNKFFPLNNMSHLSILSEHLYMLNKLRAHVLES
jgi:hypothetical protein